jgi:antirestriction protein ArdC
MKNKTQPTRTLVDIQNDVTQQIITALEQGRAPWVRPWKQLRGKHNRGNPMPHNAVTGNEYTGINFMLLGLKQDALGYESAGWLTFAQAIKVGGNVKKGEKGTRVIKVGQVIKTVKDEKTGEEKEKGLNFLREFTVFNLDQCEKLPESITAPHYTPAPAALEIMHAGVAGIVKNNNVNLQHGGNKAFYAPAMDKIQMPAPACFDALQNYEATLLHELTHWTGNPKRLNRPMHGMFGNADYAKEELVAELGAAFMCAALGIDGKLQHAEYIASWLRVLKNDKKAIFHASTQARKAAEFLQGVQTSMAIAA